MTAPELSPAERATVARFDAAPNAPESLADRVERAIYRADDGISDLRWWRMASAAIAVLRGDQ